MDSLSANDNLSPSVSTTADEIEHNASVKDNRMTRMIFGDGPDVDTNGRVDTPEGSAPPGSTSRTSKKRKVMASQDHELQQPRDIETSLDSRETATKSGLRDLKLVKAAQSGASVLDREVRFESPWHRFCEKFEVHLGGYVSVVADQSPPYDIFMVKRLKGPDTVQKVRMLQRVRHQNFHSMVDCFSFDGSHYAVFQHLPVTLANIVYSPPYPTERELAAALAQVRPCKHWGSTC
jgi:hypothetical protein